MTKHHKCGDHINHMVIPRKLHTLDGFTKLLGANYIIYGILTPSVADSISISTERGGEELKEEALMQKNIIAVTLIHLEQSVSACVSKMDYPIDHHIS